ncbi:MAG TPA: cysteine--tRNA ligase [Parachlamydiales bacterium]|nr:MAG: cysteine--tRNA ligase [Chlamydiae bacterium GWA2_50_15]OGN57154.1 MAG: cysteine--tRNA ligase [Chlamydiae bacterium RIFCSPHIGHO2_02_FULL_49_29]OGN62655.1 MAG: cysteine--tRNA ligase [Chlamydiae bacterium RIFCSPHIGHO2_12_FULL_49_32]OGN72355.1 MAG: cysteine--tRNA ligase [Chlamydiae bacterium RIFCSPLOWO2_12_FULL_49_12]HAZ15589.1 cysteine--tRNA ligase [Parachlamydiales bacterium]
MKLYNTETRQKEEVVPLQDNRILLYTCGPTVYNFAHIGNFRTYLFEDLLRRFLKFAGFQVRQVMNITDLDDKTIQGSLERGLSLKEFTEPYAGAFFEDLKTLRIEPAEEYPRATDYIPQMIKMIQRLLECGYAYRGGDGCIYYSIDKFSSYGRLSHLRLDELQIGASQRMFFDEYDKEEASDFVLWKAYDPKRDGEIYWESPFGPGRPGWHIECSAMAMHLLGESIDIHVGGVDNIFPHHENEIAQSEAYSGKRFARCWLHSEHLLVDHKKMSKSLGNFYTLRDLLEKGYRGEEIRYLLLQVHYRTQLNFTFEGLDGTRHALERLRDFIIRLRALDDAKTYGLCKLLLDRAVLDFSSHLADDLNISQALASLFDLVREVNILADQKKVGREEGQAVLDFLEKIDQVLAVLPLHAREATASLEVQEALHKRSAAREKGEWKEADRLRAFILSKGYVVEDTPKGPRLKRSF